MSFISYAQNYEDVILWRALKNIENGFYVDVGANDPTEFSVTRAFYDRGWSGINIEPVYSCYERLKAERTRDINLNIAIGNTNGEIIFYEAQLSALSTLDKQIALKNEANGVSFRKILTPIITLSEVLEKYAQGKDIHFMNIDVEGGELAVLQGLDLTKWRPWIIVIEATLPTTNIPSFVEWEPILLKKNYDFVYFDALNRFYIAKEHSELKKHFGLPPNLFDGFVLASQVEDQQKIHLANAELSEVRSKLESITLDLDASHKTNQKIINELINELAKEREEKKALLQQLEMAAQSLSDKENVIASQTQELVDKEQVIQNFRQSWLYTFIHGPFRHVPLFAKLYQRWQLLKGKARYFFMPHIGVLYQHDPKPCNLPASYYKVEKLIQPAPVISIVTPSYNYAPYIERTIRSVLNQGYPELEYIIQDGGSTDGTVEIIKKYEHRLKHFQSHKDNGQSHAINLGFQHATGEIMAYLNADDVLLPGTLDYVANYFAAHPDVDVVYGHRLIINEDDLVIGDWIMPPHDDEALRWADYIPQETLFWRRRIWEKVGSKMDENFQFAMDWDLLLRFQAVGAKFKRLPRFLAAFRVHTEQKTSTQISGVGKKEVDQLRLHNFGREVDYRDIKNALRFYWMQSVLHFWLHKLEIKKQRWQARRKPVHEPISWYEPESVYFYSLHKAGTALFTHVLRQANELKHVDYETMLFDNELSTELTFEKYGHLYGVFRIIDKHSEFSELYIKITKHIAKTDFVKDKNVVYLVRDPRDIIISFYYSMGLSHVSSANPQMENELQETRNRIRSLSLDEFALRHAPVVKQKLEILYRLSKESKHSVVLRYEDLLENFDDFLYRFSKYISIPKERQTELFLASRPRDGEDIKAHKRSGKSRQYLEKLKPETVRELNRILKPVLEKFGYKIDDY
ncbi:MAG: FkbM family methyltransferase [Chloroflexota bacterium]|jgi:FkbM family methyltransferase